MRTIRKQRTKTSKMDALKVLNKSHYSKYGLNLFPKNPANSFETIISYAKEYGWTDESIVEIFTDLSQIENYNDYGEIVAINGKDISLGLFSGVPRHSNFFYLIVVLCKFSIPKWFFEKYVDNEKERERWIKHVYGA